MAKPQAKQAKATEESSYHPRGLVKGLGTSTSDSIPAKYSKGEVVIPANVVKHFGLGMFKKMIAAVPPQLGAKTTVKDGVVNAAAGVDYQDIIDKTTGVKGQANYKPYRPMSEEAASYTQATAAKPTAITPLPPEIDPYTGQTVKTPAWKGLGGNVKQAITGIATDPVNVGMAADAANQALLESSAKNGLGITDIPRMLISGASRAPSVIAEQMSGQTGVSDFNKVMNTPLPIFNKQQEAAPTATAPAPAVKPTAQPATPPTTTSKPAIPATQTAIPAPEVAGQADTYKPMQIIQREGGRKEYRNDLGGGNYIGDGKQRSPESVARMRGILSGGQLSAEDSQSTPDERRAKQAKIVDDRYAWAKNREAERNQETQQQKQQGYQDYLMGQIQQANARLASGDLGGKHAAANILANATSQLNAMQGNQQQAGQFGQNMAWNRENAANLGAIEGSKQKQQMDIEKMKLGADAFGTRGGGYDPNTGQIAPGIVYSKKTGLDVGKGQQAQDEDIPEEEYQAPAVKLAAKQAYEYAKANPNEQLPARIKALVAAYLKNQNK